MYYETIAGGQGARPGRDGMSGVHTAMTNTKNTPIEALERAFPLRVRRLRLRRGQRRRRAVAGRRGHRARPRGARGRHPVAHHRAARVSRPWGLAGGEPGAVGENWLLPGGDEAAAEPLPDKCTIRCGPATSSHAHPRRRRLRRRSDGDGVVSAAGRSPVTSASTGAAQLGHDAVDGAIGAATPGTSRRRSPAIVAGPAVTNT